MIFVGGPNFHFVRIWQILYGFYTSRHHKRNNVVHLFIKVLHFSAIFRMKVEPWLLQKEGGEPWALKVSQEGKISWQNIVKFILVFHGFLWRSQWQDQIHHLSCIFPVHPWIRIFEESLGNLKDSLSPRFSTFQNSNFGQSILHYSMPKI